MARSSRRIYTASISKPLHTGRIMSAYGWVCGCGMCAVFADHAAAVPACSRAGFSSPLPSTFLFTKAVTDTFRSVMWDISARNVYDKAFVKRWVLGFDEHPSFHKG